MPTGTVKWFDMIRGCGFITPDDGGRDAFVHITTVNRAGLNGLAEGEQVEYELTAGKNAKLAATNLVLLK